MGIAQSMTVWESWNWHFKGESLVAMNSSSKKVRPESRAGGAGRLGRLK